MAIKGGDLIHVGNQILIDRAQTAGPGQVNIPTEKIYELGNYQSIATTRDTPDLTFSLESFDVSAEFESLLLGLDFATLPDGTALKLAKALPIDVSSLFKPGFSAANAYDIVGSVSLPYLVAESVSYRFGLSDNATQSASLRGDSVFYNPGNAYIEQAAGSGVAGQEVTLANPAYPYNGDVVAGTRYALSVSLGSGKRLTYGTEFSEVSSGANADGSRDVTVTVVDAVDATDLVRVTYSSPVVDTFPQDDHEPVSAVRPAALRGRNIEVFVGGTALTDRWTSVQSVNVDFRVTLDKDEEFGNSQIVSQDFDVPEVSGSIEIKPRDYADLYKKVRQIAGVPENEVAGPLTSEPLPLLIVLNSPESGGGVLKTIEVPDARFTFPGFSGRVQQKMTVTFNFESDTGDITVYHGAKP